MAKSTSNLPLWERSGFVPCRVGDTLTPEQEAAALPGLDGVLRDMARAFAETTLAQHSTVTTDEQKAG